MLWIKYKWKRFLVRLLREKATPEFIARGWAIGMFYGCTIPFGLQLLLSIPTALIMKGSRVGATLGTFITNHFTIFIIYPVQCWVANRLMGGNLSYSHIAAVMNDVIKEQSWQSVLQLGTELMEAFFLGGFILAAVLVPITYFGVLKTVRRHRQLKAERSKGKNARK